MTAPESAKWSHRLVTVLEEADRVVSILALSFIVLSALVTTIHGVVFVGQFGTCTGERCIPLLAAFGRGLVVYLPGVVALVAVTLGVIALIRRRFAATLTLGLLVVQLGVPLLGFTIWRLTA